MTREAPLQLRILGTPAITWADTPFTLRRRQVRALLYRLAVTMEPVPRDALLLLFWPEATEAAGRRNLSRLLNTLRRDLPHPDILQTTRITVRLNPDLVGSDSAAFSALTAGSDTDAWARGVDLVRGPFLSGFSLPNAREYSEWHSRQAHRIERRYLEALGRLVHAGRQSGEHAAAISYAERYLATDELAEEMHRQLMTLYAQTGRRSAALAQFERCVLVLERELGVSPLPETRAVYEAVRAGKPPPAPPAGPAPSWSTLPGPDVPLVGRETDLAALDRAYVAGRSGGVIFITGPAGVGKSRLLHAFSMARRGLILGGDSQAGETAIAYLPLVQALRQALPHSARWRHVPPIWLTELSRLLPELRAQFPDLPPPPAADPQQAQARLFEALRQAFCGLTGESPLLLCLDDVHWADESTLAWLLYFVRRQAGSRVCILATYRSHAGQPLRDWQRALQRANLMTSIRLEGLAPPAVAALLRRLDLAPEPAAQLAARIHAATGGNPFFVLETMRAAVEADWFAGDTSRLPLSPNVREAVLRRVGDLPPLARQVLEMLAVLAPAATAETIAAAAGRDGLETATALDVLAARQLVRAEAERFRFQHDLAREAIYQDISPWRQRLLHRRAAQALAVSGAPAGIHPFAAIADHFEKAGESEQALRHYRQAAEQAQRRYANPEAVGFFEKALSLANDQANAAARLETQSALFEGLGQVLRLQAQYQRATAAYQAMLAAAEALGDHRAVARSLLGRGQVEDSQQRYPESLQSAARAETLAQENGLEDLLAYALYARAWALFRLDDLQAALPVALAAAELSTRLDQQDIMARSHNTLGAIYKYLGRYDVSERHQREALALFERLGDRRRVAGVLGNLGATARLRSDFAAARDLCQQAVAIATEIGERDWLVEFLDNLGFAQLQLRAYRDAEATADRAIATARAAGSPVAAGLLQTLGNACAGQEKWPAALDAGRAALARARESRQDAARADAWFLLGRIAAALDTPIAVDDVQLDAPACLTASLHIFTNLGDKPRATTVARLLAQLA